jgi:hypothetical protein
MATIKVWHNGASGGQVGPGGNPGERGEVKGWSLGSSRSNTRFLYSVRFEDLDGQGWSVSLSLKDCPTAEHWNKARIAWLRRLDRLGVLRVHWITEWQARGVPHLHAALWFDGYAEGMEWVNLDVAIWGGWCDVVRGLGMEAADCSQHTASISDVLGWLKYLSKHAARGAGHYQRLGSAIPVGWDKTGRMWGHRGSWPVDEPLGVSLDDRGWYVYRRLMRGYRVALARALGNPGMIRAARRLLRWPYRESSGFRGVSGWIPESVSLRMLSAVESLGGVVES